MYTLNHSSYQTQANGGISSTPALAQLRDSIQHTAQQGLGQGEVDINPPDLGQFTEQNYVPGSDLHKYNDQLMSGLEQDILRRRLERKEKLKQRRKANKTAKRAQAQALLDGTAENPAERSELDPAPKRPRMRPSTMTYNEGKPLPQATGPIQHYVLVESTHGAPLDEAARINFLGCYTRALALLPVDSPHRGFISTGVILYENKIKITCLTPEGADSVLSIVKLCQGYKAKVCVNEKMSRVVLGVPRYMAGPEMSGELIIRALEALNHAEEDPLPVDGMRFVSKIDTATPPDPSAPPVPNAALVSVVLDIKDAVLDWLKKHRWELKTVSSVARAQLLKT